MLMIKLVSLTDRERIWIVQIYPNQLTVGKSDIHNEQTNHCGFRWWSETYSTNMD